MKTIAFPMLCSGKKALLGIGTGKNSNEIDFSFLVQRTHCNGIDNQLHRVFFTTCPFFPSLIWKSVATFTHDTQIGVYEFY